VSVERIASYVGFSLVIVAVALFWLLDIFFGMFFTIFVAAVIIWYLKTKKKGDTYMKEVASITGCKFQSGGFGYGFVTGSYKGHDIEIKVNKDYNSLRGIAGFAISSTLLNSAMGVLVGIRNFTSVKVKHDAHVEEPFKLAPGMYVDEHLILYLPASSEITGLPKLDAKSLVADIDKIIKKVEQIEGK
jgi:hypothetical protein